MIDEEAEILRRREHLHEIGVAADEIPEEEILRMVFCDHCGDPGASRRRQRTQYADDASNWAVLCDPCQDANNEYWDDRWAEYYQGLL
jgi:RNA polymerase-binding transcription factor DksA